MAEALSQQLRRDVKARAGGRCEYCLMPESFLLAGCEVDHIISRKHGGLTDSDNLAFACLRFNRANGSDVGSVHPESRSFVRLFNPRSDHWTEHFKLQGVRIIGCTPVGEVTVKLLRLNEDERLLERTLLLDAG